MKRHGIPFLGKDPSGLHPVAFCSARAVSLWQRETRGNVAVQIIVKLTGLLGKPFPRRNAGARIVLREKLVAAHRSSRPANRVRHMVTRFETNRSERLKGAKRYWYRSFCQESMT